MALVYLSAPVEKSSGDSQKISPSGAPFFERREGYGLYHRSIESRFVKRPLWSETIAKLKIRAAASAGVGFHLPGVVLRSP